MQFSRCNKSGEITCRETCSWITHSNYILHFQCLDHERTYHNFWKNLCTCLYHEQEQHSSWQFWCEYKKWSNMLHCFLFHTIAPWIQNMLKRINDRINGNMPVEVVVWQLKKWKLNYLTIHKLSSIWEKKKQLTEVHNIDFIQSNEKMIMNKNFFFQKKKLNYSIVILVLSSSQLVLILILNKVLTFN